MSPEADLRLTIGELAEAAGMTVRNVRNHQSRGLIGPPQLEARTGYYGAEHLERLKLIQAMQADGFNLEAIRRVLSGSELRRVATVPAEAPAVLTAEELAERFGGHDPAAIAEAERLGVLRPLADGRYEAPSPVLLRAADEAVALGVSLEGALRAVERVHAGCATIAGAFVGVFERELLRGEADPVEAVERLRPVAVQTVVALFDQALTAEAGRALERST
jgi:DNA-binding transcriptional MerR regulator